MNPSTELKKQLSMILGDDFKVNNNKPNLIELEPKLIG